MPTEAYQTHGGNLCITNMAEPGEWIESDMTAEDYFVRRVKDGR